MIKEIITIKIGTSVSFTSRGVLDEYRIDHLAAQIGKLQQSGRGVVVVASGAVACGHRINHNLARTDAASFGQAILTSTFFEIFKTKNLHLAQILVRADDITLDLAKTVHGLMSIGVVPLFNENDAITTKSDFPLCNDFLAVKLAQCIGSRTLLILSTMQGSKFGVGGGEAKLKAVELANSTGIEAVILDGKVKDILLKTLC